MSQTTKDMLLHFTTLYEELFEEKKVVNIVHAKKNRGEGKLIF